MTPTPIRVCVAGITGWTGRPVAEAIAVADDLELVGGVSRSDPASSSSVAVALDRAPTDVLVDYTHAAAVRENVLAALERKVNVVVGSSGLSAAEYEEIDALARKRQVGVIAAGNFSVTAALLLRFSVEAARHLGARRRATDSTASGSVGRCARIALSYRSRTSAIAVRRRTTL